MFDVLIIGSGPAGLTAAIYTSRANKKVGVVEGLEKGGQLMKTTQVENYPGYENPILGPNLMIAMYNQAKNLNTIMIADVMLNFEKEEKYFKIQLTKETIQSKALIIATGAKANMLGIEEKFIGFGVSTCATCDGQFFKNQEVAVIGGGNTALEEAIYLSNIAKTVHLIHRRKEFKGDQILQERIKNKKNITILTPYEAVEFIGEKTLKQIKIKNTETKEEKILNVNGSFTAIGHHPNTQCLNKKIELTNQNYVKNAIITEIAGLFVAGDVHDHVYRQAITAAGYGCMAAIEAIKYVETISSSPIISNNTTNPFTS